MREPKRIKPFWIFLLSWSVLLTAASAVALVRFYDFLEDYQTTYEDTRPKLYMESLMPMFSQKDTRQIVELADPVELCEYERTEHFVACLDGYLAEKAMDYGTKAGEHIEEHPVYVVTADQVPFAVVRLKKQEQTAAYGLPLWETGGVEILPMQTREYFLEAPATVTVTVNGISLAQTSLEESGMQDAAADYLADYAEIPTYSRYALGQFYSEPQVSAVNPAGEAVEVAYDEQKKCYLADFGGDSALQAEVEEYVINVVMEYAMYVSNDRPYNALDTYFPKGSKLLAGIKTNQREWFDAHETPEIKNQKMTSFTVYSPEAFSAQVYLEQYMYVPFSKKTEMLVTDQKFYFVKQEDGWKVAGIVFE